MHHKCPDLFYPLSGNGQLQNSVQKHNIHIKLYNSITYNSSGIVAHYLPYSELWKGKYSGYTSRN